MDKFRLTRPWDSALREPELKLPTTSTMVGPFCFGFPPKAESLLRKARPANVVLAKPGNSQGILTRSL